MLPLFQLLLAVFAIYSVITFEEEMRLLVPLGCLIFMFIVNRIDKGKSEKKTARKSFLQSEMDKVWKKESTTIKDQDFFTIESLLWPKSELLLIDAVHFVIKDLGFKISAGINYHSVDRIVKIPDTEKIFGVEILMSEGMAEKNHPKINRALQFEKEKREREKTLIIASTHIHLPLSERSNVSHISKELVDLLVHYNMSFITAHHLYELWQKAKGGEIDIFEFFQNIYSHRGGIYPLKGFEDFYSLSVDLPIQ
jgi:hypothetical protein